MTSQRFTPTLSETAPPQGGLSFEDFTVGMISRRHTTGAATLVGDQLFADRRREARAGTTAV